MTIGARNDRCNIISHFPGDIDDVRTYNRVLEDIDVLALTALRD